jgi:hypothetical protein
MPQVEGTGTVSLDPGKWWVVALLGALSIAAGVLALAYPDITLLVLGLIVGINLVFIGVIWISLAMTEAHSEAAGCCASSSASSRSLPGSSAWFAPAPACSPC